MSDVVRRRHRLDDPGHRLLLADRTMAIRRVVGACPAPRTVLDIGCGAGDSLATFIAALGPARAFGVDAGCPAPAPAPALDLYPYPRLAVARDRIRPGHFAAADGRALPFRGASFDVVLLFTVLSSVPADDDRRRIATEALRVLRPGAGALRGVLVYDFAVNPVNRETRGLSGRDVRILFPGCAFREERVTPLPALARRLARTGRPRTWLARLPVPRTHHLTWITRG